MWIRTQRRDRLIDCSHIEYVRDSEIEFIVSNDTVLAIYPTKERCLEVLDEIEKNIADSDVTQYEYYNSAEGLKVEYTYKLKTIYQMPEV